MTIRASLKPLQLFGILFICISVLLWAFRNQLTTLGIDHMVLIVGNFILFIATLLSFILYKKSLQKNSVQYILKMIYGGMFAKMIICVLAAVIYILAVRSAVNKFALFGCFGLYFIYTFIEIRLLMQLSKGKKNA